MPQSKSAADKVDGCISRAWVMRQPFQPWSLVLIRIPAASGIFDGMGVTERSAAAGATGFAAVIAVEGTAIAAFIENGALFLFPFSAFTIPTGIAVPSGFVFQGHFHLTVQGFLAGAFSAYSGNTMEFSLKMWTNTSLTNSSSS